MPSKPSLAGMIFLSLAAGALLWPAPATPGDSSTPRKARAWPTAFECRFTEQPIRIDGKGDDEAWRHAQAIDTFYLPWLGNKARPAGTATRAKLLWDREYLYFLADMEDADLHADAKIGDGPAWEGDCFGLFLKPADDHPGYYEFRVNAAGARRGVFLPRHGAAAKATAFPALARVRLRGTLNRRDDRDEGWSVEGRIPWTAFLPTGGRPEPGERWKLALCRQDDSAGFARPELSTCAPLKGPGRADFHQHEDYGTLTFVGPGKTAARPHGIERRRPVATSRVVGSPEPPSPYRVRRAYPDLKLSYPIFLAHQPGSDLLLVIHQPTPGGPSHVVRFRDDPKASRLESLVTVDATAYSLAFHPDFRHNGFFYVGCKGPTTGPSAAKKARVVRYTMGTKPPHRVDPASAKVIIEWPSDGHDGLGMGFGKDGLFYLTTGDGTSDSDTNVVGQDMSKLLAKVLRLDLDHPDAGKGYSVPADNPFVGQEGARPEIWALGLRNPWRLTVDSKTGHVWVGQNGQDLFEQAFLVKKGANYGWSVNEGSHPFYPGRKRGPNFFTPPTIEHPHSEFRSLTGGVVYYGAKYPELRGAYVYGDYSTGKVWAMRHDGDKVLWHKELAQTRLAITGFGTDSRGELLVVDYRGDGRGGFYALEPTPSDLPASTFPRKLSDSGLFKSVKGHVIEEGMIPYSVNAVLWSDGAAKQRWLYLPADTKIDVTPSRGWNFPDRTTIVKSFYLDFEEGNPASRKWIETRFLTKQDGEWFGYSYAWDDAQTEGTLVAAAGADRDFTIRTAAGRRTQTWHYPSRTECMVCHSRAANYVLGFSTVQFNKEQDYGGVKDNQLRVLEHLGLLRVNWYEEVRGRLREEARVRGLSDARADAYVDGLCATRGQRSPVTESALLAVPPAKYPRLVNSSDRKQDLGLRARSYLHSNCAQCHVEAGGGNAQMELEFTTPLDRMRVVNVRPVHDSYGIADARLVYPGHPEKSVLLHRVSHRRAGFMPPLATRLVDRAAVELLRDWILYLGKAAAPGKGKDGRSAGAGR
jgi:glucose/arabinose dehydrogenase